MEFGFLSLLPVLTVLIVAVSTKRVLFAMFCGTVVGTIVLGGTAIYATWTDYLYQAASSGDAQWLIFVTIFFGILIAIFEQSGAVHEFALWARKYVNTKRKSLILTFILGIVIFLDDYLNNLVNGTAMKTVTDKYKIPRTSLAYVVNSTAAPVCVLIPVSSWAVFFGQLLEAEGVTYNGTGIGAYIHGLPLVFYGWFALLIVILFVLGVIPPIGPMKKQFAVAAETGKVFPDREVYAELNEEVVNRLASEENEEEEMLSQVGRKIKPNPWNFLVPTVVTVVVTIVMGIDIIIGTIAGIAVCAVMYLAQRKMSFKDFLNAAFDGVVSMGFVAVLVMFAYMLQFMNESLGLADYVISVVEPILHGGFLPAAVFLVCGIYAYTTGCFWDLAAIITPIVIPLAVAMGVDPILAGAAIFSGAAFGSNTCLYGDAMVLVSKSTDLEPADSMLATLPYALIAGGLSIIAYLIAGFVMM